MANATKWSNGKYKTLYHMNSKPLAVDCAKILPQLAGKFLSDSGSDLFQPSVGMWSAHITEEGSFLPSM
jgi:hypothetical protein